MRSETMQALISDLENENIVELRRFIERIEFQVSRRSTYSPAARATWRSAS